ncbi:conserved hypothetical protein [Trichinella spiralis]|uniref:hypothetical protein n=1 Tax=Trichinella spiralis TaxID=6334 RepID=UPI0001EFC98A|nr:conserved hypothetical protein [Trichinella spiralis]
MNEETGRRQFPFAIWNRTRHNWKERKAYRTTSPPSADGLLQCVVVHSRRSFFTSVDKSLFHYSMVTWKNE